MTPEAAADQSPATGKPVAAPTRERILDVALDRFTRQGYSGTSLREIAEDVGVSKAALYYHFPSKEDIFLGLHLRFHRLTVDAVGMALLPLDGPLDDETWAQVVDELIGVAIRNRPLIALHLREQDVVSALPKHGEEDQGLEERLGVLLRDTTVDPETRIRRLAALGSVVAALFGAAALGGIDDATVERVLRDVSSEVLKARS